MTFLKLKLKSKAYYATLEQWEHNAALDMRLPQVLPVGTEVDYVAHVVGGMLKVRHNNQVVIIHPSATNI